MCAATDPAICRSGWAVMTKSSMTKSRRTAWTTVTRVGLLLMMIADAPVVSGAASAPFVSDAASAAVGPNSPTEELVFSLIPPGDPVAPGDSTHIDLIVLNPGQREVAFTPPMAWKATATSGDLSRTLLLRADAVRALPLAVGGFARQRYMLSLPAVLRGSVVLCLESEGIRGLCTVIQVTPDSGASGATANAIALDPMPIQRTYPGRFGTHEPIYFICGNDAPGAKFQVSLKYRLLTFASSGTRQPQTLQFGYTQRSLWDIAAESSPFYDTSYMPEVFYQSAAAPHPGQPRWFTWLGYQVGYRHESNGRDGRDGRSLNYLYALSGLAFALPGDWHVILAPQLFTYVFSLDDNRNIRDYRSYGRLQLGVGRTRGPSLSFTSQPGRHFKHHTLQVDVTVPARIPWLDFLAILQAQYFHGYGESLLSYEAKSDMLRAGLSLVR